MSIDLSLYQIPFGVTLRNGETRTIVSHRDDQPFPFAVNGGWQFQVDGSYFNASTDCPLDIVAISPDAVLKEPKAAPGPALPGDLKSEDGWKPWGGGECPFRGDPLVEIFRADAVKAVFLASDCDWSLNNGNLNITAYRVIQPDKVAQPPAKAVWMVKGDGPASVVHYSRSRAMDEARRLAEKEPGTTFHVLTSVAAFRAKKPKAEAVTVEGGAE